ncbi:hypothetical protein VARIO8X_150107 [Burkholderiales bacterium 8X]|nr:hypothetical protein VARIO8X_150107 [Burkholderiales bacterium 8X]
MQCSSQLGRGLMSLLGLTYTQAALTNSFECGSGQIGNVLKQSDTGPSK